VLPSTRFVRTSQPEASAVCQVLELPVIMYSQINSENFLLYV